MYLNTEKMKAIYKSIFACLALLLGMTACNDDYEMPSTGGRDNAEQLAVGTYVGTWSRTNVTTGVEETSPGSIIFALAEEEGVVLNNVSSMTLSSEGVDLGVSNNTSVCNISRLSSGVLEYWNTTKGNPFGMTFTGSVSPDGVATMVYNKIVRSGRREVEFNYVFTGSKQ